MFADPKIPPGFFLLRLLPNIRLSDDRKLLIHRWVILVLTYFSYVFYHATRKPLSVVKNELLQCPVGSPNQTDSDTDQNCTSWIAEMSNTSHSNGLRLLGVLDSTYLIAYAIVMFFSGFVAERVNIRYYLSLGMIFSGIFTCLFGLGRYFEVHAIAYYIFVQLFGGAVQTTGWPSVVTIVANWFGKGKRGLIFGLWNSHTSIGNILGSFIAGQFVDIDWSLSFIVPGCLIAGCGFLIWFCLIENPEDVGIVISNEPEAETQQLPSRRSRLRRSNEGEVSALLLSSDNESDDDPEIMSSIRLTPEDDFLDWTPAQGRSNPENQGLDDTTGSEKEAINFCASLRIPGVIEFSLCLFFAKLVSYTFLFWLPSFIKQRGLNMTSEVAAYYSIFFDVGGILGGILAGIATDLTGKSASTCAVMLVTAIPMLFAYNSFGHSCPLDVSTHNSCYWGNIAFLIATGLLVTGPYALITTAVSAELGTHKSLKGSRKALATVASVIDGTGSVGAAAGPFLAGAVGMSHVFYLLMASDVLALCFLVRLVKRDIQKCLENRRRRLAAEDAS